MSVAPKQATCPDPAFRGVLLDWRGTLVVAPTYRWLVRTALDLLDRDVSPERVDDVLARLQEADAREVRSSTIDTDATVHRKAYAAWFSAAGVDEELAASLYAVESDPALNPFAADVGPLLRTLSAGGVRIGVVSDVPVDLRPSLARQVNPDGSSWADLVDGWALSYQLGVAKPDPAIFTAALDQLGVTAEQALMVGDRSAYDGSAAELGITTLLLPPLRSPDDLRLQRVVNLAIPGVALSSS